MSKKKDQDSMQENLLSGNKTDSDDENEFDLKEESKDQVPEIPINTIGTKRARIKKIGDPNTMVFNVSELVGEFGDVTEKYEELNVDKMLEYVGHEGRYQYMMIAQASIMSIVMSMTLYASSYLLAGPDFKCFKDGKFEMCTEERFCELNPNRGVDYWKAWPEQETQGWNSYVNWKYPGWTYKYGLVCDNEGTREAYLMMTELIPAIIGLLASVISDTYGRVKTFKIFSICILTISLITCFIPVALVQVIGLSVIIGEEAVLCTLITYIINESCTTTSKLRSRAIAFYFSIFAMGGAVISGVSYGVQDPFWLYLIMCVLSILSFIPVHWIIYEPPKQLFKAGRCHSLFRTLAIIAKRNGSDITIYDIQREFDFEQYNFQDEKLKFV